MVASLLTLILVIVLVVGGTMISARLSAPRLVHARHLRRSRRLYPASRSYATGTPISVDDDELTRPTRRMRVILIVTLILLSTLLLTIFQTIIR